MIIWPGARRKFRSESTNDNMACAHKSPNTRTDRCNCTPLISMRRSSQISLGPFSVVFLVFFPASVYSWRWRIYALSLLIRRCVIISRRRDCAESVLFVASDIARYPLPRHAIQTVPDENAESGFHGSECCGRNIIFRRFQDSLLSLSFCIRACCRYSSPEIMGVCIAAGRLGHADLGVAPSTSPLSWG